MHSEPAAGPQELLLVAPSLRAHKASLLRALAAANVRVRAARDLKTALARLAEHPVDILVSDFQLPSGSGLDLVRALRQRSVRAPALLLCSTERPLLEALDLGAFCLELPLTPADLVRAVTSRLASPTGDASGMGEATTSVLGRPVSATAPTTVSDAPTVASAHRARSMPRDMIGNLGVAPTAAKNHTVAATAAKNQFGRLLGHVLQGERVVITKHESPAAVLISFEEYKKLYTPAAPDLDALRLEFDRLMARMQEAPAQAAGDALFASSPDELSEAALAQASRSSEGSADGSSR